MSTLKRIWFEGAMYHVTVRGNHRETIFKDEEDFKKYLECIEEALLYYQYDRYEIICYCLMTNHAHIMVRANSRPLGDFIGRISAKYTKYFNKKYECIGHLFQGRYHSEIIKNDIQLLETSRYIHLNPVKAEIIKRPEEYEKSSYSFLINRDRADEYNKTFKSNFVNPDFILKYFGEENKHDRYKRFVESRLEQPGKIYTPGV